MLKATIIVGGSYKFRESGRVLKSYLERELYVTSIHSVATAYLSVEELFGKLRAQLSILLPDDILLLSYFGHGLREVWDINEDFMFSYNLLAKLLIETHAKVLFVNDCCHSASAIEIFESMKVPKARVGLIASCGIDQVSAASPPDGVGKKFRLALDIAKNWRQGTTTIYSYVKHPINKCQFDPHPVVRWGAELDKYFFKTK